MLKARRTGDERQAPYAPAPVDEVVATIRGGGRTWCSRRTSETASGMLLPDDYIRAVAAAVH